MPTDRSTIFCELGYLCAVIDAHHRGHPCVIYLLLYYTLATLSTKKEANIPPTQHIVMATALPMGHTSHTQD